MNRSALLAVAGITLVVAIAAGLRLGAANGSVVVEPLRADAREYFLYAYNLRLHGVYSRSDAALRAPPGTPIADGFRPPGYPLFLAAWVDGPPEPGMLHEVLLAQAVLGVLTVVFTWAACRCWMPVPAALLAALLTALSPHLVNSGIYLLTESLFTLLLAAALWLASRGVGEGTGWNGLLLGLLFGLASLVRSGLLLFAPLTALLLLALLGWRRGARVALLLMVGFAAVQLPWALRNLDVDSGGHELLLTTALAGMYPNFMYRDDPVTYGYAYRFDPQAESYRHDAGALLGEFAPRFREQPAAHLRWFVLVKPMVLWSWDIVQGQGGAFVYETTESPYYHPGPFAWSYRLMQLLHWPLVLLGAAGTVLAWRPSSARLVAPGALFGLRLAAALLIYFLVLHVLLAPYPRYSVPLRPMLYSLAMLAVWRGWRASRGLIRR